ncbi:MAG TPA: hypothetical protein DGB32_03625, partial [Dehalococcoidia bacterium]|nr:hypothetical protein [Dehalococcoidia bacterium]
AGFFDSGDLKMPSRLDNPLNGYFLRDKHGTLLPGGTMEFYEDETDTPSNVYAPDDLEIPLGYVIEADAYGLMPDFSLMPNQDYTVRVYDADGAFQWSRGGVANNIVNLEDRVRDLESAVSALGTDSGPKNLLTNGGCKARRFASRGATFPVRDSWALGEMSGIFAQVGSATAGTFHRHLDADFGNTGVCARLDNVTTDSSESEAEIMWRMPSGDGANISGDDVVFHAKVRQNSGSPMNVFLTLYKCLTADDFDGDLVTIAASAPLSASSGEELTLTLPIENPGDLSTGVAVVVTFDCGIVANTNMDAGEAQLERGGVATQFENRPELIDKAAWSEEDLDGVGVIEWYSATLPPPGRLIANDDELLRADYPRLWYAAQTYFEVVSDAEYLGDGTTDRRGCFSSGDGSTTFRVPDLITRKAHVRAHDPADAEREPGEFQPDQMPEHTHGVPVGDSIAEGAELNNRAVGSGYTDTVSTKNAGAGTETRVANYNLLPCIKY